MMILVIGPRQRRFNSPTIYSINSLKSIVYFENIRSERPQYYLCYKKCFRRVTLTSLTNSVSSESFKIFENYQLHLVVSHGARRLKRNISGPSQAIIQWSEDICHFSSVSFQSCVYKQNSLNRFLILFFHPEDNLKNIFSHASERCVQRRAIQPLPIRIPAQRINQAHQD